MPLLLLVLLHAVYFFIIIYIHQQGFLFILFALDSLIVLSTQSALMQRFALFEDPLHLRPLFSSHTIMLA